MTRSNEKSARPTGGTDSPEGARAATDREIHPERRPRHGPASSSNGAETGRGRSAKAGPEPPSHPRPVEPTPEEVAARLPLPGGRLLGAHLPLGGGMVKAVDRARAIGAHTLQIFADNPTAWKRRVAPPVELPAFRRRLEELAVGPVAIHAAYLINLAGPNPDLMEKSVQVLRHEMEVGPLYGARFVNVHIGSHLGTGVAEGAARVGEGVHRVLAEVPSGPDAPLLVLENSSGGGGGLGASVDELADVLEAVSARGVPEERVALCLDAAHLWGAGYAIDEPEGLDRLLDELEAKVGLERVVMVHFNDSRAELGSRADRHEHVGAGKIGPAGMGYLLTTPRLAHAAYYIETPGMDEGYDALNIARAHDLAAGRPLADLPAGALAVRSARSRTAARDD